MDENFTLHSAESKKLLILLHGLMGSKDAPYRVRFAERMNAQGYNVLRFNFKKGCGKDINHSDIFSSQLNQLEDICSSFKESQIGIMGACTGANVALLAASRNPVKCVFALAPFSIPLDYTPKENVRMEYISPETIAGIYKEQLKAINNIVSERKRGRVLKKLGLFVPSEAVQDFLKYNICRAVSNIPEKTNVCFVIGDNDPLISPLLTLPLYQSKRGLGEWHEIKSRSHGYINPSEADCVNNLAETFFLQNL